MCASAYWGRQGVKWGEHSLWQSIWENKMMLFANTTHTNKFQVHGGRDLRNKTLNDVIENIRRYFYDLGGEKDFFNKINLAA